MLALLHNQWESPTTTLGILRVLPPLLFSLTVPPSGAQNELIPSVFLPSNYRYRIALSIPKRRDDERAAPRRSHATRVPPSLRFPPMIERYPPRGSFFVAETLHLLSRICANLCSREDSFNLDAGEIRER